MGPPSAVLLAFWGDGPPWTVPTTHRMQKQMTSTTGTASDGLVWRKARMSVNNGACVEVALHAHGAAFRDSKDPEGIVLRCNSDQWHAFLRGARQGKFDGAG
jgi:hypothetical protein